jgi:hypothetical protein
MSVFPIFLMRILRTTVAPEAGRRICIVVQRPYEYIEGDLRQGFVGEGDVEITVDRRHGERRTRTQSIALERRRVDRRQLVERIVDVVLS